MVTAEPKSVKIWTYEFSEFELFLDVHIPFKKPIKSLAVAEAHSLIVAVGTNGKTYLFNYGGDLVETLEDSKYQAVCADRDHVIFGNTHGALYYFDLRFMQ